MTGSFGNEAVVLGEERPGEPAEHLSDRQLVLMVPVERSGVKYHCQRKIFQQSINVHQ